MQKIIDSWAFRLLVPGLAFILFSILWHMATQADESIRANTARIATSEHKIHAEIDEKLQKKVDNKYFDKVLGTLEKQQLQIQKQQLQQDSILRNQAILVERMAVQNENIEKSLEDISTRLGRVEDKIR